MEKVALKERKCLLDQWHHFPFERMVFPGRSPSISHGVCWFSSPVTPLIPLCWKHSNPTVHSKYLDQHVRTVRLKGALTIDEITTLITLVLEQGPGSAEEDCVRCCDFSANNLLTEFPKRHTNSVWGYHMIKL